MLPGSDMQSAAIHRSAWPPYRPTRSASIDNYLYHLTPCRCFQWKSPQIMKEDTRLQTKCISHAQLPHLCTTEDKNSSHPEYFEAWATKNTTQEPNADAPTYIWALRNIFSFFKWEWCCFIPAWKDLLRPKCAARGLVRGMRQSWLTNG